MTKPQQTIEGRLFEARRSRATPARLWGTPGDLRLQVEGEAAPRRLRLTGISDRLGGVPRKLTFEDGSVFEAPADAPVDGLVAGGGRGMTAFVARLESSWRIAAAATVLTVVLLFGIHRYGLPLAASAAAAITPDAVLTLMDNGSLTTIDEAIMSPTKLDAARQAEVTRIFNGLRDRLEPPQPPLKLIFRDGGAAAANAFALPGGTIIITDQLVQMATSEDEIAGVLAHEIGHVEGRHSLQQIYRALGVTALASLFGGDSSQLIQDVVNQAAILQSFAYSREFEAAADARSVELTLADGRNPILFIDILDRISAATGAGRETGYLSSHPGTAERRRSVEEKARALGWCAECGKADHGQRPMQ